MMKLQGHEATVWAVQMMPEHGLMLTGRHSLTTHEPCGSVFICMYQGSGRCG